MNHSADPTPDDYEWVINESPYFGVGACVTMVLGMSAADILKALGVTTGAATVPFESDYHLRAEPAVGIADKRNAWVPLIELNGWQGSLPRLLCRLSQHGRAASMYWNVNSVTRLSLAENGQLVFAFEVGCAQSEIEGDTKRAMDLVKTIRTPEGDSRYVQIGLAMLQSITHVTIDSSIFQEVAQVYLIDDWS